MLMKEYWRRILGMIETDNDKSFRLWSEKWDIIFKMFTKGKCGASYVLEHTLRFDPRWVYES